MEVNQDFFSNHQINIDELPTVDQINYTPIEISYWKVLLIQSLIVYSIFISIYNLLIYSNDELGLFAYIVGNIIIVVIAILNIFLLKKSFNKRSYAIRMHDVVYKKGLLGTSITAMPYKSVQHVKLSQGILSKRWQLTTIILYGAGGQQQQLTIAGINELEGAKIKDFILSKLNVSTNNSIHNEIEENDAI